MPRAFLICATLALLAMVACAQVSTRISVVQFPYFPLNAGTDGKDGTYVWAVSYGTQLQGAGNAATTNTFSTALCSGSARFGTYQFDFACRQHGPSNSRAVVCSSGQNCGSSTQPGNGCRYPGYDALCGLNGAAMNPRSADSYMVYGRGRFVGPTGNQVFQRVKPVYAFDLYRGPTPDWIRVANSIDELFTSGVNRGLALTQSTGLSASAPGNQPFQFFYGNTARAGASVSTSPADPDNNVLEIPGANAWTGCGFQGQGGNAVLPSTTCLDWTYVIRDFTVAAGIQGNPGYIPYTSNTFVTDWLNNGRITNFGTNPFPISTNAAACNLAGQYYYCSWNPTNDDGYQNGDETGVDCGGTTMGELNTGNPTPNCTCAPGFFQTYTGGPCNRCPVDTYCRTATGCFGSCTPCHPFGTTTNAAGVPLTGQTQCVCRPGYQTPLGYNPVLTGIYDGSYCQLIIRGDPQITGLQGQDFQVHGIPDEYFNLISHPELQVNSRFVYLEDAKCDNFTTCFTHAGTYIDEIGIMNADGEKVKVVAGTMEQGLRVFVNGKEIKVGQHAQIKDMKVHFTQQRKVQVATPLFKLAYLASDMFMNQEVTLMDSKLMKKGAKQVSLTAAQARPNQHVPLHGIVGQTWQNIKYPEGMFIEGAVADYRVEDGLFGTDFVYNKFAPRVNIMA